MVILEAKHIKKVALDAGFDLCGVTSCQSFPINRAAFESWLNEGYDSICATILICVLMWGRWLKGLARWWCAR